MSWPSLKPIEQVVLKKKLGVPWDGGGGSEATSQKRFKIFEKFFLKAHLQTNIYVLTKFEADWPSGKSTTGGHKNQWYFFRS